MSVLYQKQRESSWKLACAPQTLLSYDDAKSCWQACAGNTRRRLGRTWAVMMKRYCPLQADRWQEELWLRFVEDRPLSAITTRFLAWCCAKLQAMGKRVLILVWDNARWHISRAVQAWIQAHASLSARCLPKAPGLIRSSLNGCMVNVASPNPVARFPPWKL